MKNVFKVLMLIAIVTLTIMCVQSILAPMVFDKELKEREVLIRDRLIAIRSAQLGYKNIYGTFAGSFPDLKTFLSEERIPFLIKEGELTDDQLKAGMTEQEAVKKGIIRRDTTWILAKDTLLGKSFDVVTIDKVPGFENYTFSLDTATLSSPSGYTVPVFEAAVKYDVYLADLDRQLLINLKDKALKLKRFSGLRVGSVEDINNNAGNWEIF